MTPSGGGPVRMAKYRQRVSSFTRVRNMINCLFTDLFHAKLCVRSLYDIIIRKKHQHTILRTVRDRDTIYDYVHKYFRIRSEVSDPRQNSRGTMFNVIDRFFFFIPLINIIIVLGTKKNMSGLRLFLPDMW